MNYDDRDDFRDPFDDREEIPDEQEEEPARWPAWYRPIVIVSGIIFALALVGVPALEILVLRQDDDDPPSANERLRANAATIFTASVLQRGSTDLAMNVTVDSLRDEVEELVDDVNRRGGGNTRVTLVGFNCIGLDERSEQCFRAELLSATGLTLLEIRFGVSMVAGSPRIIDVIRGESLAFFTYEAVPAGTLGTTTSDP
ncbi:MAG: hypothetical protein ACOC9Y_06580 [Chloroflexota bacterium]